MDGDYSFALWDGDNLAIVRDPLGVKPLFYSINNDFSAFASSRDSLHDISCENIHTLKPGHILFNWNIYSFENIHEKRMYVDKNKLEKLLKDAFVAVDQMEKFVILKTLPGNASAAANLIDKRYKKELFSIINDDDNVLMITRTEDQAVLLKKDFLHYL